MNTSSLNRPLLLDLLRWLECIHILNFVEIINHAKNCIIQILSDVNIEQIYLGKKPHWFAIYKSAFCTFLNSKNLFINL